MSISIFSNGIHHYKLLNLFLKSRYLSWVSQSCETSFEHELRRLLKDAA